MRDDPKLARIPVVAMSSETELLRRAAELGVDVVMSKPLDPHVVTRVLERYRS